MGIGKQRLSRTKRCFRGVDERTLSQGAHLAIQNFSLTKVDFKEFLMMFNIFVLKHHGVEVPQHTQLSSEHPV